MTTGEKMAALRRKKGLTQEQLAEMLKVSRQSVSRWEMDVTFPETDKLIKLSRILETSIDFLLNDEIQDMEEEKNQVSIRECQKFIRECGYFFLATSYQDQPKLRPMGMLYSDNKALYISTDKRKNVYEDLMNNSHVELASYNLNSRKWIRITGSMRLENSIKIKEEMKEVYPMIKQEYIGEEEMYLAIFRLYIEQIRIH